MPHPAPAHRSFADRNTLYQQISDKIIAELEQAACPAPGPPPPVRIRQAPIR